MIELLTEKYRRNLFLELRPYILRTVQDRMIELVAEEYLFNFMELRPEVLRTFQDRMIELVAEEYLNSFPRTEARGSENLSGKND